MSFDVVGNVNVRLHSLVVAVARPFHHHLRKNTQCKGITDESATPSARAKQGIFRSHLINALIAFIVGLSHRVIDFSKLSQFFEVIVHLLIRNHWQSLVVFKLTSLYFSRIALL